MKFIDSSLEILVKIHPLVTVKIIREFFRKCNLFEIYRYYYLFLFMSIVDFV